MTRKVYKSAMGKAVDLGALLLQNEQVRAVGNMNVNSAGDLIDSNNRIIDQRNRQVQRQYKKQTNVTATEVVSSTVNARKIKSQSQTQPTNLDSVFDQEKFFEEEKSSDPQSTEAGSGGLAAAIAKSREVKQELEKTMRQRIQEQGLKKI
jgi:hypothetical protein